MDTTSVGARIKEAREAKGLTQAGLGSRLDPPVDQTYVSRWEKGKVTPRGSIRIQIADALGVDVEWLRTGQGQMLSGGQQIPAIALEIAPGKEHYLSEARHTLLEFQDFLEKAIASGATNEASRVQGIAILRGTLRKLLLAEGWEIPEDVDAASIAEIYSRAAELGVDALPISKKRKLVIMLASNEAKTGEPPTDEEIKALMDLAK